MCPSGATCLHTDCCFSELGLQKLNQVQSRHETSSSLRNVTCSHHDIDEKLLTLHLNNNHSLTILCYELYLIWDYMIKLICSELKVNLILVMVLKDQPTELPCIYPGAFIRNILLMACCWVIMQKIWTRTIAVAVWKSAIVFVLKIPYVDFRKAIIHYKRLVFLLVHCEAFLMSLYGIFCLCLTHDLLFIGVMVNMLTSSVVDLR
jgi:hypothetical protein